MDTDHEYTRRQYLLMKQLSRGVEWMPAQDAVDQIAKMHDDWDMDDETRTYRDWEDDRT